MNQGAVQYSSTVVVWPAVMVTPVSRSNSTPTVGLVWMAARLYVPGGRSSVNDPSLPLVTVHDWPTFPLVATATTTASTARGFGATAEWEYVMPARCPVTTGVGGPVVTGAVGTAHPPSTSPVSETRPAAQPSLRSHRCLFMLIHHSNAGSRSETVQLDGRR